ncbi:MAG TPA: TonB family protein [Steroidobacteraceae bacterium]|nr:TonB family protein [Steroidobacteraceae bacterium]
MRGSPRHDSDGRTVDTPSPSLASDIVELVVLTVDDVFLQTLREAVGASRRLWHVASPDKVSDLLLAGSVGILVLDVQALQQQPGSLFIAQIKRQFPDLVIVVAGAREAEAELARLISEGTVYRFIHKPMSPARAQLFADAAVKRYGEQRRRATHVSSPPATPGRNGGMLIAVGCAAICAIAGILYTLSRSEHGPATPADPTAVGPAAPDSPPAPRAEDQRAEAGRASLPLLSADLLKPRMQTKAAAHPNAVAATTTPDAAPPAPPAAAPSAAAPSAVTPSAVTPSAVTPSAVTPPAAAPSAAAPSALSTPAVAASDPEANSDGDAAAKSPTEQAAGPDQRSAPPTDREPPPALSGQLSLVKSVQPEYPQAARAAAIEGWVELDFTVTASGRVQDISVRAAQPRGVFDRAAISALSQWRYQPASGDSLPGSRRARIRIRFALAR